MNAVRGIRRWILAAACAAPAWAQAPSTTNRAAAVVVDEWQRRFRDLQELQLRQLRLDLEAERMRERLRLLQEERALWEAREKQLQAETASARATIDDSSAGIHDAPRPYMVLIPSRLRGVDGAELPVAPLDIVIAQPAAPGDDDLRVERDGRAYALDRSAVAGERELLGELAAAVARVEQDGLAARQRLGALENELRDRSAEEAKFKAAVEVLTSGRVSHADAVDFRSADGTRTLTLSEIREALPPLAAEIEALRGRLALQQGTVDTLEFRGDALRRLRDDVRARFAAHTPPPRGGLLR
jgi:hypothetical protein